MAALIAGKASATAKEARNYYCWHLKINSFRKACDHAPLKDPKPEFPKPGNTTNSGGYSPKINQLETVVA